MNCQVIHTNGTVSQLPVTVSETESLLTLSLSKELFPADCDHIDFCPELLSSGIDPEGYAIAPRGTTEGGTILTNFRPREDCEYISDSNTMPVFGFKTAQRTVFAIVTGMTYEYKIVVGVKNNTYYIYPRFFVDTQTNYEDICVEYHLLPAGSDYNDMAALYKSTKPLPTLAERAKDNPQLRYAIEAPELRIRLCWKPVPAKIAHQTLENEPDVVIGCTLDRVKDILDGMKSRGIDSTEVCLVGIEVRGHDGRWPQLLPIEESIGGQEKLEELCKYGQSLGYQMVVHTNSTEMYQISSDWTEDDLIITNTGDFSKDPLLWGGGQPFHLCPACTVKYTERNLIDVQKMGFSGLHYIDVLTNFPPRDCYNPKHPMTARDSARTICGIAERTRELFGGFASEGGFDYAAGALDYVLYTAYNLNGEQHPIVDDVVPLWQLVYHGTILYNPSAETVNYHIKDAATRLRFIEYGGRPVGYINSKYVDEDYKENGGCGNWMGTTDLLCATEEDLSTSLDHLKAMYDEYKALSHLQLESMLRHDKLADGVYQVTYSDGTLVTVDYNAETYTVKKA